MRYRNCLFVFLIASILHNAYGVAPILNAKESTTPPPRIIRTCCSFGSDLRMTMVPGAKYTDITEKNAMGSHAFLGNKLEMNGIIYTRRGGFIDMGHLRDQADWTAYLYLKIKENINLGIFNQELGHEGGKKTIEINIPQNIVDEDIMKLAGRIAYDLSVWHEIATWFGCSYIPLIPERYSSFSPEDAYSNLLGVQLGIQALQSKLPYEMAMSTIISETLDSLDAVSTFEDTFIAMESVRGLWWSREFALPSSKILLLRELSIYNCTRPWIIPSQASEKTQFVELQVPNYTTRGENLNNFYKLSLKLNRKFPFKEMFPERKNRIVTQLDFEIILKQVAKELSHKGLQYKQ